jgi:hypothetical protein
MHGASCIVLISSLQLLACANAVESVPSVDEWMRQHTPPGAVVAQSSSSPSANSQPARVGPDGLPLRNLQIELRQVQIGQGSASSVAGSGAVVVQGGSTGSSVGGSAGVSAQASAGSGRTNLQQNAIVLNGRAVNFTLGQTVPLRLLQTAVVQGRLTAVPSKVLIERNSGFSARPVWLGGSDVEVEIATSLARGAQQTSASTSLQLPLNEWIAIAESAEDVQTTSSGILSRNSESSSNRLRVEIRLSLR